MSSDFSYFFTCQRKSSVGLHDFISWPPIKKRSNFSPLPPLLPVLPRLSLSPSLCPFMHPLSALVRASTSIQASFSSLRFSSFWKKRRGSSVLRLVLPKAPCACSNAGAEGLLLGALRCALIASHSTSVVWERVAMATQSLALLLFTRAICCQVAGVTSPCLANVSIKSSGACLKACALYAWCSC